MDEIVIKGARENNLKNVNISTAMLSFQKSMFGNMNTYKNDVSEVIVSKNFIVSCIVK